MDEGSPVALDFSYGLGHSPQGFDDDMGTSNIIGGYSISHAAPEQLRGQLSQEPLRQLQHHHHASMASLDSVVEQSSNPSRFANGAQGMPSSGLYESGEKGEGGDPDHAPTWVELKTKAGKERKRLPLACIACRRKKIKCSGEKPACKHCLKARTPCVYKVTARKAAPRTDYMAMLDKRLKRMEDRVIRIIPKEDLPDTTQRSSVRPPLPGTTPKPDKDDSKAKRSAEDAFTTELQDWSKGRTGTNQLDGAAKARTSRDAENKLLTEGAEALPQQHIQEHLAEVFFDCIYGQSYLLLHKPSFMRKLKAGTVPPVLILAICAISARFSTHPQVSTEPAFLRGEQWATPARSIVEKRHFEPNIIVLTTMVILGLHYFGTCEGGLSWSFGGQAMRMGYALQLHKELDHDPLGTAQAERAAASGKPVPRMQELSFTDREIRRRTMWACFQMDTFNSSGTERPSFLNEDYMFIQLPIKESHFQMEIPGHTEDINGHIPLGQTRSSLGDAEVEAEANMGVAAYVIRAIVVWKRIVKYLNLGGKEKDAHPIWDPLSHFASLQRQIAQLKASLPPSLEYNQDNLQTHVTERSANQFLFLHIVIAQTSLFLHRFAIPTAPNTHRPYPPNTPRSFLATAATTVLDAAGQISKLLNESTGHTLTVPFAGYCAYASATVHVWGIFSKNVMLENTSREYLRHNYKYLNRMKRYWGMFHYMAESIKDTYRSFADAAARSQKQQQAKLSKTPGGKADTLESGAAAAELHFRAASPSNDLGEGATEKQTDGTKAKVFQYGDWFNKYPHGVSEQEWEQRHLPHRSETQKGTEAVMSQQAELQSVEEFFAGLSPPSRGEDGPNTKKANGARKRGKSMADVSGKSKGVVQSNSGRKQSNTRKQSQSASDAPPPSRQGLASNSMYPLSNQHFPQLDLSTPELDVPMSGMPTGLQSGQGNSAFDLTSPTAMFSAASLDNKHKFPSLSGPTSNPSQGHPALHQQQPNSPFDYTSPTSSSNTNTHSATAPSNMSFSFNYTSAVPQLDRQMVFGGYAGIDPSQSGHTNALNNINSLDFWSNPWDASGQMEGAIDMDGFSGFNDPSFGLNATGSLNGREDDDTRSARKNEGSAHPPQPQRGIGFQQSNNSQNQNMSSTAWFMPFNIDPPNQVQAERNRENSAGGRTLGELDEWVGFDSMMDMGISDFGLSPAPGEQQRHDSGG